MAKKVSIIGLGYVGLPLLCAIAKNKRYQAFGFDISEEQINQIKKRECPISDEICEKELKKVDITVDTSEDMLEDSDIFITCVPTPVDEKHNPDYTPVRKATETVAKYIKKGSIVVVESTINPGTCEDIVIPIIEKNSGLTVGEDLTVAHCPERINPGDKVWNIYNITRNIGAKPAEAAEKVAQFYRDILDAEINTVSSLQVAEATKVIENTFRDINIAYVNELAKSFDRMGIDLHETITASSNKPFAFMPHWPSCGVGGHCIPVDPYYLIQKAASVGFNHRLLREAREVNNSMPEYTVDRLIEGLNEIKKPLNGTSVGVLGISFKANVGDSRESPSFDVINILKKKKALVHTYDPYIPKMSSHSSLEDTVKASDTIILCTNHDAFKKITATLLSKYNIKVVVDGKNFLDRDAIKAAGIIYRGIGRK